MATQNPLNADKVFKNGAIYTVDSSNPWARAVAIGVVAASVGSPLHFFISVYGDLDVAVNW